MTPTSEPPRSRRALGYVGAVVVVLGTLVVTMAAFTLSYDAIRSVGIAANMRPSWAWMLPVSIDGAMGVATVAVLLLKQIGRSTWYPWLVVAVGVLVSAGCNGLHATGEDGHVDLPVEWARAVGVIPPLMLALSVHLLAVLVKALSGTGQPGPDSTLSAEVNGDITGQVAPGTAVTAVRPPRTDAPEQAGQVTPDRAPDRADSALLAGRTGRTGQVSAPASRPAQPEPVRPAPVRTEQAADLHGRDDRAGGQVGGQADRQGDERPDLRDWSDVELVELVREQAADRVAAGDLSRGLVERLTGLSARRAEKIRKAALSAREQTEQTELAGANR